MHESWGSVDGDGNADAIIADRRHGRKETNYNALANFIFLTICAVWYALTESSTAMALQIIAAAWLVTSGVRQSLYQTHTMLLITERRVQLIEQNIQELLIESHRGSKGLINSLGPSARL